jgi:hypothetical protein
MEVSMSFCLSDLRKVERDGAWAEIVDGMVEDVLCLSLRCYEVDIPLEWWRCDMICLVCALSDSVRPRNFEVRDFMVEGRWTGVGTTSDIVR